MPDTSQGKVTPIQVSTMTRIIEAVRYTITGVKPDTWMSPQQPLVPMAEPSPKGRAWDYPVGFNLNQSPRSYEGVSFGDMRALAETCDILRLVIEHRKDQIAAMPWSVRVRKQRNEKDKNGRTKAIKPTPDQLARIDAITEFLQFPDKHLDWNQWNRALFEDLFVIDAPTVYKRPDNAGRLWALEIIDGATIKPLIDADGRTPLPPDPAYQQVLKGIPAVDYSADELLYMPRNLRSWKVYGYSPVEQIIITTNTAIRRAIFNLDYYTEGNQPDAIMNLPSAWTQSQVEDFQKWWDSLLAGNLAQRRRMRMVPGDQFKYQEIKAPPLKDNYDEWLARIICYCFSVSYEAFVSIVNRATAQEAQTRATEEGLGPLMLWHTSFWNRIISDEFGSPDLEFAYEDEKELEPDISSQIDVREVNAGIRSIDEVRESKGLEAIGGNASKLMVLTGGGYVPVDQIGMVPEGELGFGDEEDPALEEDEEDPDAPKDPDAEDVIDDPDPDEIADEEEDFGPVDKLHIARSIAKMQKASKKKVKILPPVTATRAVLRSSYAGIRRTATTVFDAMAPRVAAQVTATLLPSIVTAMKAWNDEKAKNIFQQDLAKAGGEYEKELDRILAEMDLSGLNVLAAASAEEIKRVAASSGKRALAQVGAGDDGQLVNLVNERAADYARERAAEMVGKRVGPDGTLIDNPNARWRIDDATRDMLRSTITTALDEGVSQEELQERIENSYAFSEERAQMIARAEVGNANSEGALQGYREAAEAGIKVRKQWLPDVGACEICQANADAGPIDLDDTFPSGDEAPMAHPNCECSVVPVVDEE